MVRGLRRKFGLADHRNCPKHHRPRFSGPPVRGDAMQRAGSPRGGGQKPAIETQPGILDALNELVEPSIRGDPEAALRWVSLSQRHLSAALAKRGFIAGQKLVGRLLERLNFSLQANCKTPRSCQPPRPQRSVKACQCHGESIPGRWAAGDLCRHEEKELVGDFKNGGRELRPKGQPQPVRVHDFAIAELSATSCCKPICAVD